MPEILTDERGNEMLRAKCHDQPGDRSLDPKLIFMNLATGRCFIRVNGASGPVAKPGNGEEADMIKFWIKERGLPEPCVECGGE